MKKNLPIIFAIAMPVLMILIVVASIYIPGFFVQPKYSFLYTDGSDYYDGVQYLMQNGVLVEKGPQSPEKPAPVGADMKLYLYDMVKNKTSEISFAEAQKLRLDPKMQSPDGFEIVNGQSNSGIFPFLGSGGDYYSKYIKGHNLSKKLNIPVSGYYNFRFLGWVK